MFGLLLDLRCIVKFNVTVWFRVSDVMTAVKVLIHPCSILTYLKSPPVKPIVKIVMVFHENIHLYLLRCNL